MVLLRKHLPHPERSQTPRPFLILRPQQPCREGFPYSYAESKLLCWSSSGGSGESTWEVIGLCGEHDNIRSAWVKQMPPASILVSSVGIFSISK